MSKKLLLASSNSGKLREINAHLAPLSISVSNWPEHVPAPEETGLSFIENAILKARAGAELAGTAALGDDSGLVVHALGGAPGIYSARYAGDHVHPSEHIGKLLDAMKNQTNRRAHFCCVMALLRYANDPEPIIFQGRWEGEILLENRGEKGFGYDPIFFVQALNKGAAELSVEEKNKWSHRGQALQQLELFLRANPNFFIE